MAEQHAHSLPRVGQRLGPYLLESILGRGGMGQVYGARDTLLQREVAVKVLWRGDADTLVHEGRALAAIDHRSVVRIHGIDVSGPRPFVVMERIRGRSVADLLEETPRLSRRLVLSILRGVAVGLDVIHAAGRMHGDIKPENVLVEDGTGRVVLTDLGLSRALAGMESARGGTPAYMAPERATGTTSRPDLWPREDVYSLAVMAFELMAGRLPFENPDINELRRFHAVAPPPAPSSIEPTLPWRVDHTLLTALAKRPDVRHGSAGVFVRQLERALAVRGGPRILIADDDADMAKLLSVRIARRLPGCFVRTVECGRTAYELITSERPDALITDVEMPGMNGLELLAMIRNEPSLATLPRAVVSGRAKPVDFAIFAALGAPACFAKPVDADALGQHLRDALHLGPATEKSSGVIRKVDERGDTLPAPAKDAKGGG